MASELATPSGIALPTTASTAGGSPDWFRGPQIPLALSAQNCLSSFSSLTILHIRRSSWDHHPSPIPHSTQFQHQFSRPLPIPRSDSYGLDLDTAEARIPPRKISVGRQRNQAGQEIQHGFYHEDQGGCILFYSACFSLVWQAPRCLSQ
jgi:hypothetical protein